MLEMTRRIYRLLPCVPLPGSLWWPLMKRVPDPVVDSAKDLDKASVAQGLGSKRSVSPARGPLGVAVPPGERTAGHPPALQRAVPTFPVAAAERGSPALLTDRRHRARAVLTSVSFLTRFRSVSAHGKRGNIELGREPRSSRRPTPTRYTTQHSRERPRGCDSGFFHIPMHLPAEKARTGLDDPTGAPNGHDAPWRV